MTNCKHPTTRFLACTAADRLPGCFVCDDCGMKFTSDPNNPNSVRYLEFPKRDKKIILSTGGGH